MAQEITFRVEPEEAAALLKFLRRVGFGAVAEALFAADDQLPADAMRWRELRHSVIRIKDALDLVQTTLRKEREQGVPLTADTARKLEGYVRFGLGQSAE
jgi:hypothetical protein